MFDIVAIVKTTGYVGIFSFVFAESGLFFGFFLPGDSLLFTAGFLASQNLLNIVVLCGGCFVAAVLGDNVGYNFGRRVGPKIFTREDSLFFKKEYVQKAHDFYVRHGGKAIVLSRFTPIVRTFAPIVAGVGEMPYPRFVWFNLLGGFLWGVGMPLAGYFLGKMIPDVDKYLLPIVLAIIVLSLLPSVWHVVKTWLENRRAQSKN